MLVISASGIRGIVGTDLTPEFVARWAAALGARAMSRGNARVVLGRDARTSGEMFARAATAGLLSVGCEVVDLGLVPTPTAQLAVEFHHAGAGLILTASHNPVEWNALKLVGPDGVFLDGKAVGEVRAVAEREGGPARKGWDGIGTVRSDPRAIERHLEAVLALPTIDAELIRRRRFRVALDCVRGVGGAIIPLLLHQLGCEVLGLNLETDGQFPREPEPLPENLGELGDLVRRSGAHLGMAIDPDGDRLALVDETGEPIGEDYTLAFAVRAVLGWQESSESGLGTRLSPADFGVPESRLTIPDLRPVVVANLSTSLVVEDAARDCGARFVRAPVGESNVAKAMVAERALIGGEGNGGVILPELHAGRDAPLGVALILQYLARDGRTVSSLVAAAARYRILKAKLPRGAELQPTYAKLKAAFPDAAVDERDGLRLAWPGRWIHLRPSGTEPVVRLIVEAPTESDAQKLVAQARALF